MPEIGGIGMLTSELTFKQRSEMAKAVPGQQQISLDNLPRDAWRKYDNNKNWVCEIGDEVIVTVNSKPHTRLRVLKYHLIGRLGKPLKTETHLLPIVIMDDKHLNNHNTQIELAQIEVDAGRGDEIPSEQWWIDNVPDYDPSKE